MASDRDLFGEYAGKPGSIQKAEDGHETLTAAEQRRVLATYGKSGLDVIEDEAQIAAGTERYDSTEKWEDAAHRARYLRKKGFDARLNGRTLGDVQ